MRPHVYIVVAVVLIFGNKLFAQPSNDNCNNATLLNVGSTCSFSQFTNANATASVGTPAPTCASYMGGDVWFRAVVPASGNISFDSQAGIITDGGMAVYSGPCNALVQIACDDDNGTGLMPFISLTGQTPGSTLYIRFWEYGNDNNGTFSICAFSPAPCITQNTNLSCATADAFCSSTQFTYCNSVGIPSLGSGGIYGCLGSTPNPAFYFLNISTPGTLSINISQTSSSGVGLDVDFVAWGPFNSQAAICNGISATNIVDCSFTAAPIESFEITNAQAGQWYMVLITNYSNQPGTINFAQTNAGQPGAGGTNCNLMTLSPTTCSNGTYTLNGVVNASNFPNGGNLTITNSCGGTVVVPSASFSSAIPFSFPNLCGNGGNCNVTASFSAAGAPTILPASYTAPSCSQLTATPGACSGGQYVLSGTLTTSCLPSTGTLTISSSCGGQVVYNATQFANTLNWQLPPSSGNGGNCTITAVYSAAGAPLINPISINEPSCCGASVGTFTITQSNGFQETLPSGRKRVYLCEGGTVSIVSNNNFILPPPVLGETSELFYAIYLAPGPTGSDPDLDPNWTGYYFTGQDYSPVASPSLATNYGNCSGVLNLPGAISPSNGIVLVPITADDGDNGLNPNGIVNHDQNNDGCYDLGDPIEVFYLEPITAVTTSTCNGSVNLQLSGGNPEIIPGSYTITNTGAGTLNSTNISLGGVLTISGLNPGAVYSVSIADGSGCNVTYSGVYSGSPVVTINPTDNTLCAGECTAMNGVVNSGVGAGNSTFESRVCTNIPDAGVGINNDKNINNGIWASSSIVVSGFCGTTWQTGNTLKVCLDLQHTFVSDVNIALQAPNGVIVGLSSENGLAGVDYMNTCFTMTAATSITLGVAPFTGNFLPEDNFSLLNGTPINGTWRLWVSDDFLFDIGVLNNWSIEFTNQNTFTYTWAPSSGLSATNTLNPNACPTTSTNYTLTATNSCGCSGSATSPITVTPTPSLTVSGSNTLQTCNGSTLTFGNSPVLSPAGATLSWTNTLGESGTTLPITKTFTNTTCADVVVTYTITPSFNGCNGTPIIYTITVKPKATSTFTVNPNVECVNGISTVTYTGTFCPGATFNWNWPAGSTGGGSGPGPHTLTWNTAGAQPISLQVDNPGGACISTLTNNSVTVNSATATPIITTTIATCTAPGTATISNYVPSGQTYSFTPTGPTVGALGVISGLTPGTSYTVSTSNGSCASLASASFSIAPQLTVPVTPAITTAAATCTAPGSATISNYVSIGQTYSFTPAGPTVGALGVISGLTPGTSYTISTSNGSCASLASASFSVASQLVAPVISGTTSVCPTITSQLLGTGTAASSNPWVSDNTTIATVSTTGLVTGVAPGTAIITYTNSEGCQTTANLTVSDILDFANLQFPANGTICQSGSFTIFGQVFNSGTINTANPGPAAGITAQYGYSTTNTNPATWTNWASASFNVQAGNNDEYSGTLSGLAPGTYYYAFRYQINGCEWQYGGYSGAGGGFWGGSNVSGILTVNAAPNAGNDGSVTVCATGSPVSLFSALGGGAATTGIWNGPSALTGANLGNFNPLSNTAGAYTYTVSVAGCTDDVATVSVSITSSPSASIAYASPVCNTVTASQTPTILGALGGTFTEGSGVLSITGAGSFIPNGKPPGTYTITYTIAAANGCSSFQTQTTVVVLAPPAAPVLSPITACSLLDSVFTASGGAWYEFLVNGVSTGPPSANNILDTTALPPNTQICVRSFAAPPVIDGNLSDAAWTPVMTRTTGGPTSQSPFTPADTRLDGLKMLNRNGRLYFGVAGNEIDGTTGLENNRILLLIDSKAGGFNNLDDWNNRVNTPPFTFGVKNLSDQIVFDAGFEPDYILSINRANLVGSTTFYDLYDMQADANTFLGSGPSTQFAYQESFTENDLTRGFEFFIPLSMLAPSSSTLKVFGMIVNDPGASASSLVANQFFSVANVGDNNYGTGAIFFNDAAPSPVAYQVSQDCFEQTCITLAAPITPTFNTIPSVCQGIVAPALPTLSNNNISGAWSPTSINTTNQGTFPYSFTPTAGSCATTFQTNVTINQAPAASITGDNSICSGENVSLNLNSTLGATTFSWTVSQSGATGASIGNGPSINQTLTTTGASNGTVTYTVTPLSGGCNGNPVNSTITITPTPILTPIFHE